MTYKSPLLFTLTLVVVCVSSSAFAGKPPQHCHGYSDQFFVTQCDGFSVMDDAKVMMHIKDYCDKNGDLTHSHVKLTATDVLYRDDDPRGPRLRGSANINDRANYDEFGILSWTTTDIFVDLHAKGLGLKFIYSGTLEKDEYGFCASLIESHFARYADWDQSDFEALCAYFE